MHCHEAALKRQSAGTCLGCTKCTVVTCISQSQLYVHYFPYISLRHRIWEMHFYNALQFPIIIFCFILCLASKYKLCKGLLRNFMLDQIWISSPFARCGSPLSISIYWKMHSMTYLMCFMYFVKCSKYIFSSEFWSKFYAPPSGVWPNLNVHPWKPSTTLF